MDPADHGKLANSGAAEAAKTERVAEAGLIRTQGVAAAFERAAADIEAKFPGKYTDAINQARNAMNNDMDDCNNMPPSAETVSGSTNIASPGEVPATAASDAKITVYATGFGGSKAGVEYDLILADSAQLAQDPSCAASPAILSATR